MVSGGDVAAAEEERQAMRRLLAAGTTPAEAAAEIFAQAARGEFFLRPQPDTVERLMRARGEQLARAARPVEMRTPSPAE